MASPSLGNHGCDDDGVKGASGDRVLGLALSLGCDHSSVFGGIVAGHPAGKVWKHQACPWALARGQGQVCIATSWGGLAGAGLGLGLGEAAMRLAPP